MAGLYRVFGQTICWYMSLNTGVQEPGIDVNDIEDVIAGAANQSGEDNRNVARMAALLAGLPVTVAEILLTGFCASGLQAIMDASRTIACGDARMMIAGGVESMTRALCYGQGRNGERNAFLIPARWLGFVNKNLSELYHPFTMGERLKMARQWNISRHAQDEFALESGKLIRQQMAG